MLRGVDRNPYVAFINTTTVPTSYLSVTKPY